MYKYSQTNVTSTSDLDPPSTQLFLDKNEDKIRRAAQGKSGQENVIAFLDWADHLLNPKEGFGAVTSGQQAAISGGEMVKKMFKEDEISLPTSAQSRSAIRIVDHIIDAIRNTKTASLPKYVYDMLKVASRF